MKAISTPNPQPSRRKSLLSNVLHKIPLKLYASVYTLHQRFTVDICCFQRRFTGKFLAILLLYSVFCIMLPRTSYVAGEFAHGFTVRISPVNKTKHFRLRVSAASSPQATLRRTGSEGRCPERGITLPT